MRLLILAAVSLSSLLHLAASQSLSGLPSCAVTCAINAIGATGCGTTDAACICMATSFLASVQSCISSACSPADQQATLNFAVSFCGQAGITITLPTPTPAPATSAPAATSSPAPAATTTEVPESSSSEVPEATSSEVPEATSSAPPAATYTGGAPAIKQQWAGVAGALGLGVAAML